MGGVCSPWGVLGSGAGGVGSRLGGMGALQQAAQRAGGVGRMQAGLCDHTLFQISGPNPASVTLNLRCTMRRLRDGLEDAVGGTGEICAHIIMVLTDQGWDQCDMIAAACLAAPLSPRSQLPAARASEPSGSVSLLAKSDRRNSCGTAYHVRLTHKLVR